MLRILLAHSYFLRFDQKQQERAKPYPPLATLQVAAQLRRAGHKVSLFDAMLADGTAEYGRLLQDTRPQVVLFYEDNFNFLSKMCLGKMRDACCEMVASARRAGASRPEVRRNAATSNNCGPNPAAAKSHSHAWPGARMTFAAVALRWAKPKGEARR